jgi:hypothetical protein
MTGGNEILQTIHSSPQKLFLDLRGIERRLGCLNYGPCFAREQGLTGHKTAATCFNESRPDCANCRLAKADAESFRKYLDSLGMLAVEIGPIESLKTFEFIEQATQRSGHVGLLINAVWNGGMSEVQVMTQ